ncbi:MAG: guanylate kinase [Gemmatimonadota bacterium]|nr:MAG: guanylate kinase [Gemmatimonadota bacterium]
MNRSFALAICAPSGTGKTTVACALVEASDDFVFSVSATTRPIRPGEGEGVDYRFVGRDEFDAMIRNGELLEWAEVHGELYGTPRANLEEAEHQGRLLILDIDVQGARQVVEALSDAVTVFLLPPSFDALMERLRQRGSEDEARLRRRLETAKNELKCIDEFQYVVINDRLEDAVEQIRAIVGAERQRLSRRSAEIAQLRRQLQEGLERESP